MNERDHRLAIALLADDFNPEWPSLPIVGYKYATALAHHAEVTVYTHVRNRPNLETIGRLPFAVVYLDNEYIARPMFRLAGFLRRGAEMGWTIEIASRYLPYLEFERLALKRIKASGPYDIVHRITPMTPTLPSFAAGRVGVPFVIGPLNGNLPWPREFYEEQRREQELLSKIKSIYKLLPYSRQTYRRAAAILASFAHTIGQLPAAATNRIFDVPEIGYDPAIFNPPATPRSAEGPVTFLYAGRLVPYKLPEIAILAFAARPALQQHRLVIAGDGPDRDRLAALVREHRLDHCVEFAGKLSQAAVAERMRASDVFFFPSIRELGAGVVVEALACGLPCLVADYGAPGALVNAERGRKVAIAPKATMIEGFADQALAMASDRAALQRMSAAARDYAASRFTWDHKARVTMDIYRWCLTGGDRPQFAY